MKPEIIIALTSAIIAGCAFFLTWWQAHSTTKHNKLSVRPHLNVSGHNDEMDHSYFMWIINNGLGPAIITDVCFYLDGKPYQTDDDAKMRSLADHVFKGHSYEAGYGQPFIGESISPNNKKMLLEIKLVDPDPPNKEQVLKILDRCDLVIKYESFYGEKQADVDTREDSKT